VVGTRNGSHLDTRFDLSQGVHKNDGAPIRITYYRVNRGRQRSDLRLGDIERRGATQVRGERRAVIASSTATSGSGSEG